MARYWVPHPEHAWLPRNLKSEEGDKVFFKTEAPEDGPVLCCTAAEFKGMQHVTPEQEEGVDDVCRLTNVTEGALLHTVRVRYFKDLIYTRVARTLIAVNPFRELPIYAASYVDKYLAVNDSMDEEPHIYGLSQDALYQLRTNSNDQAVLISGESGAGKTESAKLILSFVADAVRSSEGWLEEQVIQTNQVLESWGNAMTVRNNNSSRFGKWLDLRFSSSVELLGCTMTSYLLETTRVCAQASKERGFHIFFQLLQARDSPGMQDMQLQEPGSYRYLKGAQHVAPNVNDSQRFEELCEALSALGFDEARRKELFRITAGTLTLGNCTFKEGAEHDSSKVEDDAPLIRAADLLGLDVEGLRHCMTQKIISVGAEHTEAHLTVEQASAARDAMARLIYGRLFTWLLACMNTTLSLARGGASSERLLGVLDLAGFESFERNSLEQLMINLSNEHLQAHFNKVVFKEELEESAREGVKVPENVGFVDNSQTLILLDGKNGVLDILDETMAIARNTNDTYVAKVIKQQADSKQLVVSKIAKLGFGIRHFAGEVQYTCEGWLEKNANKAPEKAKQLLSESSCSILQEIGKSIMEEDESPSLSRKSTIKLTYSARSVSQGFRASLQALVAKIDKRHPHFIRCVKPNMEKVPRLMTGRMAMEQLLFSGVLATVQIRQQGYAYRVPHKEFMGWYRCLLHVPMQGSREEARKKAVAAFRERGEAATQAKVDAAAECTESAAVSVGRRSLSQNVDWFDECSALVDKLPTYLGGEIGPDSFAMGKSKVFMKTEAFRALEEARRVALHGVAVHIQRMHRGRRVRRGLERVTEVRDGIRSLLAQCHLVVAAGAVGMDVMTRARTASAWYGESATAHLGSKEKLQEALADLDPLLQRARELDFQNADVLAGLRARRRLALEVEAHEELESLMDSTDIVSMEKAAAKGLSLGLPKTGSLLALEERIAELERQRILAMEQAIKAAEEERRLAEEAKRRPPSPAPAPKVQEPPPAPKPAPAPPAPPPEPEPRKEVPAKEKEAEPPPPPEPEELEEAEVFVEDTQKDEEEEEEALLRGLAQARREYDAQALEDFLRRAEHLGLPRDPAAVAPPDEDDPDSGSEEDAQRGAGESELAAAKRVLLKLQDVDFLLEAVERHRALASLSTPSSASLRRLERLTQLLRTRPGFEEEAAQAVSSLQRGLIRRATADNLDSMLRDPRAAELEMATFAFKDLSTFCNLKPVWRQPAGKQSAGGVGLLRHSKVCLSIALTTAPPGTKEDLYEGLAVQNFRNILVCMEDRPRFAIQRFAAREAVLELPKKYPALSGEVYLQVLKQLTLNPRRRSSRLGWELLLSLIMTSLPRGAVCEFVRTFLTEGEGRSSRLVFSGSGVVSLSRACLAELNSAYDHGEDGQEGYLLEPCDIDGPAATRSSSSRPSSPTAKDKGLRRGNTQTVSPWLAPRQDKGEVVEFIAGAEVEKIGLTMPFIPMKPLVVKKVVPKTWAYRNGIQVGDVVTELNGVKLAGLSEDDFQSLMRHRPLRFTIDLDLSMASGQDVNADVGTQSMCLPMRNAPSVSTPSRFNPAHRGSLGSTGSAGAAADPRGHPGSPRGGSHLRAPGSPRGRQASRSPSRTGTGGQDLKVGRR